MGSEVSERTRRRIALVGPAAPFRGGIAQFTDTVAAGLRGRGWSVHMTTFRRQYPKMLFPGTSQFDAARPAAPDTQRLIDSIGPATWIAAARTIAERRPAGVVFQYWTPFFAPAYGVMARRLAKRGVRVAAIVHNVYPHERRHGLVSPLAGYFLKQCGALLALSDLVAADVQALGVAAPVHTSPHPVYGHFGDPLPRAEARRRLGVPEHADVLLFFGFVRAYKGLRTLLRALPRVRARRPAVRLVIAGEFYEDERAYRDLIASLGLAEAVLVRGEYIPEAEVGLYFSAANLVVQPYESATQSGVAQTAWHFDRPVVTTDVGGLAEVVTDGVSGYVTPPGDPEALADAIVRYFEENREAAFAEGVRRERERFSWDPVLDALETMLGPYFPEISE